MLIEINENESNLKAFCKYNINSKEVLVGLPLTINYREDPLDTPETLQCFYGLNPKENFDIQGISLHILDKKLTNDETQEIYQAFYKYKDMLNEKIRATQPTFFDNINSLCYRINQDEKIDITNAIISTLTNKNEQPLLLAGLSGYGKTASLEKIINDMRTSNATELQAKYGISQEKAENLKKFSSYGIVNINEEASYKKLMGNYVLSENEKGEITTVLENGALGSLIKDNYYGNRKTLVVFDELLDSPDVMTAMKASLMPRGDFYNFAPINARNFLFVNANIDCDNKMSKMMFLEVAQKSDNLYSCDDNALEINEQTNTLKIQTDKLSNFEKQIINNSLPSENQEQTLKQTGDFANISKIFTSTRFSILDMGGKILLISQKKANEIKNLLDCKEILKDKPFVLYKDNFKVCATGNVMNNIDVPTRDRFNVVSIGGISYSKLKENLLVKRYGIDSPLVNKLDKISSEVYEKVVDSIIKLVRSISELQNQDVFSKPDFGLKQVAYSPNELTSPSLNPRLITNIINQSENLNDISEKFKQSAERILGLEGLPDNEETAQIIRFKDNVNIVLEKELDKIAKEYKIDYALDRSQEEKFLELTEDLPSFDLTSNKVVVKTSRRIKP